MTEVTAPIEAVVFDAYGTLFDVHTVSARCDALFPGHGQALSELWRQKQLEYTWLRSLMRRYEPFDRITADALCFAATALGLPCTDDAVETLMQEYAHLRPFPEVGAALQALSGRKLAILSNGTPDMLNSVVGNAGLTAHFTAVLSVDPLRIYKPDPAVYRYGAERLAVAPEHVAFVSSNYWDIAGATSFGFRTYWVNRGRRIADRLAVSPAGQLNDLTGLVKALGD